MQFRSMSSFGGSRYPAWSAQMVTSQSPPSSSSAGKNEESGGYFSQFTAIRDSFASQLQDLTGSLPEAGPLSAAFRERLLNSIYLLFAAAGFGTLAVFVGLPTLVLRPSKFVLCLSLSTLLAAASVIVMQKPSVFLSGLLNGGAAQSLPVVSLLASQLVTLYITVFVHRYVYVLSAALLQLVCLLYYLASFVPGGAQGLHVLLRMMYALAAASIRPVLYMARATALTCFRGVFSD